MSMNIKNNLSDVCRVCLEKPLKLYPLEGPILNNDVYVSTMIMYCTSVEVVLCDDLPRGVCLPCFKTIRIAYNFIKQFRENNEKLLSEREIKESDYIGKIDKEYIQEDNLHQEEQLEELKSEESINDNLSDDSCDDDYKSSEEKIIIRYVNDDGSLDKKCTPTEICENSDKETTLCGLTSDSFLNRHMCPICLNIFCDFKRGLVKHLQQHHQNTSFKCNKCSVGVVFTVGAYITHYTKAHLYQCPICNRSLGSKSSFYYHSKVHIRGSPYHCPHQNCNKMFLNQFSLRKHINTHSDTPKYICSKCGKKFKTYDTFRYHNKTHDGKRSHLCNVCGRTFLQSVHLKYHMWHHTGVKQFSCGDCSKSYTSVTQLKKHRHKYCGST